MAADLTLPMLIVFAVIAIAVVLYALDRFALELVSFGVVSALLLLFSLLPALGYPDSAVDARQLLMGFADPALFAILALLTIGQAMVQTGALEPLARQMMGLGQRYPRRILLAALMLVMLVSAFLNNTPVVVIFIPILSALAQRMDRSVSLVMIPLSFAAVLGGNMTLIGSSTNLLAAGAYAQTGGALGFFDLAPIGMLIAATGLIYVLFVAPRLLRDRASLAKRFVGTSGKQFIVQFEVTADSPFDGQRAVSGLFPGLPNMTVRMIQRGEKALLPPYDDIELRIGDLVVVAATRKALTDTLGKSPDLLEGVWAGSGEAPDDTADTEGSNRMIAETMVAPASRMDGRTLSQIGFRAQTGCVVLGIQRRSRMIRADMSALRLEAGDVLLVMGPRKRVLELRTSRDLVLLEWSATDFPSFEHARRALLIFLGVVATSAGGLLAIETAAMIGALAMIGSGCLNIHQAFRALDRRVIMIVGAALAMGTALTQTNGAEYLATKLLDLTRDAPVMVVLSSFFLLVAFMTNLLSNNATAVLFTPIAASVAERLGVDPKVFIMAVIYAANCSFATPMSYQTNLLVMGPGHYRFIDYLKTGVPLIVIVWIIFTLSAPLYFGL